MNDLCCQDAERILGEGYRIPELYQTTDVGVLYQSPQGERLAEAGPRLPSVDRYLAIFFGSSAQTSYRGVPWRPVLGEPLPHLVSLAGVFSEAGAGRLLGVG